MNLSSYVTQVRDGVTKAAALADDHTRQVAERLGGAIDASTRLALIQALSDAAGTISAELAPASVEVRMVGQDPEFVVSVPTVDSEPTLLVPERDSAEPASGVEDPAPDPDDEPIARISLRLPQSVKARVDEKAAAEQISTNAWLIRAVMDALAEPVGPPGPPRPPVPGPIFGPDGPFGPHGVFGPHGPFGIFTDRGERSDRREAQGRVQGWVR
ncbi:MAG TPA: ribbon-helix-helix protein, CopG family [Propionibacteriaceae bacterium]|nr:ribbon-helix-helix protein, CopG family [Propionibacteriaceae bacterium]